MEKSTVNPFVTEMTQSYVRALRGELFRRIFWRPDVQSFRNLGPQPG